MLICGQKQLTLSVPRTPQLGRRGSQSSGAEASRAGVVPPFLIQGHVDSLASSRPRLAAGTWQARPERGAPRAQGISSQTCWPPCSRLGCPYKERWRKQYHGPEHINRKEVRAYLQEESFAARAGSRLRLLTGLDSQVALGALVKGRSASGASTCCLSPRLAPTSAVACTRTSCTT